jgi:hypothetical protein
MIRINNNKTGKMKKSLCIAAVLFLAVNVQGQSHFLTLSSELGVSGLNYKLTGDDAHKKSKFGWNARLDYGYFFDKNWGISTGVGVSHFQTVGGYNTPITQDNFILLGNQVTDDNFSPSSKDYQLRVRLGNWEEIQKGYIMEVPILGMFQHKFGKEQKQGLYVNLGIKLKIPVSTTYQVQDGESSDDYRLNVSGYFPTESKDYDWGGPDYAPVSQHGFGSISNPYESLGWEGDIEMTMGVSVMAEFGFSFQLAPWLDLLVGAYIDAAMNNMKKSSTNDTPLLVAPENYLPAANGKIGEGIVYNGLLNSNEISKMKTISYGGKISFKFTLGR